MLIPYVTLADPEAAMSLYKHALGATTTVKMDGPEGGIMHAEMSIGGDKFMLGGEWSGMSEAPTGRSPENFMLYVLDVDEAFETAVAAEMTAESQPENMFWGDRIAKASDGHGYEWTFAQEVEAVSPEEIERRAVQWAAGDNSD